MDKQTNIIVCHFFTERGVKYDRIQRAVGVCKKIVSAFSYSWKKRRDLAIAQDELGLSKHVLTTEMPTRWGSRHMMIQRVLEQERAISQVLKPERKSRHLVLSWQDVDVLEAINKVLSPLQDFTDALSEEQYVSFSYLKPVLHLFNTSILAEEENDTQLTKDVKRNIVAYLNDKYSDPVTNDLLDIASFLDSRFRATYIEKEKVEQVISRAVKEIKPLKDQQEDALSGAAAAASSKSKATRTPAAWSAVETHSQRRKTSKWRWEPTYRPQRLTVMQTLWNGGDAIRQISPALQS